MRFRLLLVLLLLAPTLLADELTLTNGLAYKDITVTGVKGDELIYSIRGNSTSRPLSQIARIVITSEPAFNAAEEAYAAKDYDKAVELYDKASKTNKPWLRDWVSQRMLDAANKGNRFDVVIRALIALAERSPEATRSIKLNMPAANSAYLTEAIKELNAALNRKMSDESKEVLLNVLVEIHNARGDVKAAGEALTRRMQLKASDPNSPEGRRAAALLKLQEVRIAAAAKDFDKAISIIQGSAELFVEQSDQAEALLMLADARAAKAGNSTDVNVWKDVALAYMRVVANVPSTLPQVPQALLRTAAIHEKNLNEEATAVAIYAQIAADYKGQEAGQVAEKELQRLK